MKTRHITLFTAIAAAAAFASTAQAAVTLSDGHTGDYRIIFTTIEKTAATETGIDYYNTFVSDQAVLAGSTQTKDLATTWTAIGSTKLKSAVDNTASTVGTGTGIHLYTPTTTADSYQLVATSYTDLWDGSSLDAITYGDGTTSTFAWFGSNSDGTGRVPTDDGTYLGGGPNGDGTGANIAGISAGYSGSWDPWSNSDTTLHEMMGMSGVIPEPTTMSVLAIGGLALLRRRKRA
jgi:hypothetical protein